MLFNQRHTHSLCPLQGQKGGLGDIDLFTLTQDKDRLTVNNKWLQHLQVRLSLLPVMLSSTQGLTDA